MAGEPDHLAGQVDPAGSAEIRIDGVSRRSVRCPVAFDAALVRGGPHATELAGCAKLYLPIIDGPPSQRPFAFVLQLARDSNSDPVWVFIAFGHRSHPPAGVRNVYQRAHRQLHGRFPTK